MKRWKVTCSYDGSSYAGWQRQTNALGIQQVIEDVLSNIHHKPIEICASGRTDALVHALGQVFHFDSDKEIDNAHWKMAMNAKLPKDIRIQKVEQVPSDFHARFHATSKRYDYLISNRMDDPFLQKYQNLIPTPLDVAYMQECSDVFLGTHDFTSFTSAKIDARKSRVKTITRLEVIQESDHIRLIMEGDGFLRYMVRMISQTLIEAGRHRLCKADIETMLMCKDKLACRYKAPACGLYLVHVCYERK